MTMTVEKTHKKNPKPAVPCRSCQKTGLLPVLDLGTTPLADRIIKPEQLSEQEPTFPLEVAFCPNCSLVQILETVPPEKLFQEDYPYFSSFSDALLQHSRKNALGLIERCKLTDKNLVVELASNDGYLLKNFVEKGVPVLGIDPADGPAKAAEKIGVPTINDFFTKALAAKLAKEGKKADVIIGNNVLAHVADTNGFVAGVATLLKETGTAVFEFPYVRDLIEHGEFDTIYHEHLCYFSAHAVDALFRRHGLYLNHVERLPIHGGSLRVYFNHKENVGDTVKKLLAEEKKLGLDRHDYYKAFAEQVHAIRDDLRDLLLSLKKQGKKIAAYGAAAKGSTMVNFCSLGTDLIDFVVDRNVHKQGKLMPGVHIPIYDPKKLMEAKPDYVLILPWNFKDEILSQQKAFIAAGGKFIVPIPRPTIL
jgi:SAM-dependent methyltransferase